MRFYIRFRDFDFIGVDSGLYMDAGGEFGYGVFIVFDGNSVGVGEGGVVGDVVGVVSIVVD